MHDARLPASNLLAAGLALGIAGDFLLHSAASPGLSLVLWANLVAVGVVVLSRRANRPLSREGATLLAVAVLLAATLAWRDSPALKAVAIVSSVGAFALPAARAGAAWVRSRGIFDYAVALASGVVHGGLGSLLVLTDVEWSTLREGSTGNARWRLTTRIAAGLAMAVPLILVFGGLLMAADAVFAQIVTTSLRLDLSTMVNHLVLTGVLSWIAAGYLRGFVSGTHVPALSAIASRRPGVGIAEIATVLGLLDLLFLAFVLVQFRYLFGGAALVEVTAGLTYAEYARHGFFQLVTASLLMLPLLLMADWVLARRQPRDEWIFRALAGAQIVLMLAVSASALERMRLYRAAYGLTELRFYATALLVWVTVLFVWFAATILRGQGRRFAFGTLVSGFAAVALLQAVNPDAIIVRTNIDRAVDGERFDIGYATSLSADAVPSTIEAFPRIPAEARCAVARRLLAHWGGEESGGWRSWNLSTARARAHVQAAEQRLSQAVPPNGQCLETRTVDSAPQPLDYQPVVGRATPI